MKLWEQGRNEKVGRHSVYKPAHPSSYQTFEKGRGLERTSIFREEVSRKVGVTFSGGFSFYIKNNLNSKIFKDKKNINKNIFLCHN